MKLIAFVSVVMLLLSLLAIKAQPAPATAPATAPAAYPLWDNKETVAQYAKRANIQQTGQSFDLGNKIALKVTLIPAGKFQMGTAPAEAAMIPVEEKRINSKTPYEPSQELPQHEVTITKPFYFGTTTVTQEQYQQLMGKNPSKVINPKNPVEQISYADAVEFCKKLSEKTGESVHLPTEAQWEYACRAGTTTPFNTGATISSDQANYWAVFAWGNGKPGLYRNKPIPVGSFKPNAWGLYDMHGNILQWCADYYSRDYYKTSPAADPTGPEKGSRRVLRGGCYGYKPLMIRSAYRENYNPEWHQLNVGFRVVVDMK